MSETGGDVASDVPLDALAVDQELWGTSVVLHVHGEVDLATADLLEHQLTEAETLVTPPAPVVLDLAGVTFLGSVGLALLIRHRDRCAEHGSPLRLAAPSQAVLRPIELAGLDEEFDTAATVADALNR